MSLVEVTIALGITAFTAITLMGLMSTAMNQQSDSNERMALSRVYQSAAEAAKPEAEKAAESQPNVIWQQDLYYTREGISCDSADPLRHYFVRNRGIPDPTLPGTAAPSGAWQLETEVTSIPRNAVIFKRAMVLVKEPPAAASGGGT